MQLQNNNDSSRSLRDDKQKDRQRQGRLQQQTQVLFSIHEDALLDCGEILFCHSVARGAEWTAIAEDRYG
jgi:hypothetical protein